MGSIAAQLKAYRTEQAAIKGQPAYCVFSNAVIASQTRLATLELDFPGSFLIKKETKGMRAGSRSVTVSCRLWELTVTDRSQLDFRDTFLRV